MTAARTGVEPRRRRLHLGRFRALIAALTLPMMLVAGNAVAQNEPIATAVGVVPAATGQLGGAQVTLLQGNQLFAGQVIATDTGGEVQIVFADDTHMVVGPNSTLIIERFLMRNATTVESFAVNALGGTFRFITGTSPHEAYQIRTPTGTIGVAGTAFDFTVDWITRRVDVIVFDGVVVICALNGPCVDLAAFCAVGAIPTQQTANAVLNEAERRDLIQRLFPYARFQFWLRSDFRVQNPQGCLYETRAGADTPTSPPSAPASSPSSSSGSGSGSSGNSPYPSKGSSYSCSSSNNGPNNPGPWFSSNSCGK